MTLDAGKLLYILNPTAGKGRGKTSLYSVVNTFSRAGYLVTTALTRERQDATRTAEALAASHDLVVCCGGDGTLGEVINGMMRCETRPPLGHIPTGSANDFAASHGLPRHPGLAARVAVEGEPFRCDVGCFNGRYFAYIAAFGAFTDVAYETPQEAKTALGHMAYILQGMARLPSYKPCHVRVEYDGGSLEDDIVCGMITNSTSVGGFRSLLPGGVRLDDGLFEVTLIRMPRTGADWQRLLAALAQKRLTEEEGYLFSSSRVRVLSEEPLPWTLDGEFGGSEIEAQIDARQRAMTLHRTPRRIIRPSFVGGGSPV